MLQTMKIIKLNDVDKPSLKAKDVIPALVSIVGIIIVILSSVSFFVSFDIAIKTTLIAIFLMILVVIETIPRFIQSKHLLEYEKRLEVLTKQNLIFLSYCNELTDQESVTVINVLNRIYEGWSIEKIDTPIGYKNNEAELDSVLKTYKRNVSTAKTSSDSSKFIKYLLNPKLVFVVVVLLAIIIGIKNIEAATFIIPMLLGAFYLGFRFANSTKE